QTSHHGERSTAADMEGVHQEAEDLTKGNTHRGLGEGTLEGPFTKKVKDHKNNGRTDMDDLKELWRFRLLSTDL
ncbi:hypothetical protein HAX54_041133, partial [Datura stramonium]|nr:hypothetical protein [Datura stramonium]